MNKTISKIIISIAIGLIVGVFFGNKNEIAKYYLIDYTFDYDYIKGY